MTIIDRTLLCDISRSSYGKKKTEVEVIKAYGK